MSEPAPSMGKLCAFLSIALMLACAFAASCPAVGTNDATSREYEPLVPSPSGNGPYTIGSTGGNVALTTKAYSNAVMIYYPANSSGTDTGVNRAGAPYPAIVWLPGAGGDETSYGTYLQQMASWGFIVMAVAVNWNDFPTNVNSTDMEDLLDYLENRNATNGNRLEGMIDKEAFGASGHSNGGGLTFVDGGHVSRIKAGVTFAAAGYGSDVINAAPGWATKKILVQVGEQDSTYKPMSLLIWSNINSSSASRSFVEVKGAGHQVWQNVPHLWHAFFMYWLDGKPEYFPFIYGLDAVNDYVANTYILNIRFNTTHFFPPVVDSITAKPTAVDEDSRVDFNATISGYYPPNHPQGSFKWDFDDNGVFESASSAGSDANYSYNMTGSFAVKFRYTLGPQLSIQPESPITVTVKNVDPIAVVGDDRTAKEDEMVRFDGSLSHDTPSDNGSLQFKWDFGDGIRTEFGTNVTIYHAYSRPGNFKVNLTIKDTHGGTGSDELMVNISNVIPTADAGDDMTVNEDETVLLKAAGNDTRSDIGSLKYKWDFGDGNGTDWSSSPESQYVYLQAGNYTVTLHVRDDHGAENSSSLVVHVSNVAPSVSISTPGDEDIYDEDVAVSFSGIGSDTSGDMGSLEYMWDFGDGNVTDWSSVAMTDHAYIASGDYEATLNVHDNNGAEAFQMVMISVKNTPPVAKIDKPADGADVQVDKPVAFVGTGTDTPTDMTLLSYVWTIEEQQYKGKELDHTFWKAGEYDVIFTVTDPEGLTSEAKFTLEVQAVRPSIQDFKVPTEKLQTGQAFNYSALAMDSEQDLANMTVLWTFGDGNSSTSLSGTYTYTKAGPYKVTLTIKDEDGETATMSQDVTVEGGGGGGGGGDDGGGKKKASPGFEPVLLLAASVTALMAIASVRRRGRQSS